VNCLKVYYKSCVVMFNKNVTQEWVNTSATFMTMSGACLSIHLYPLICGLLDVLYCTKVRSCSRDATVLANWFNCCFTEHIIHVLYITCTSSLSTLRHVGRSRCFYYYYYFIIIIKSFTQIFEDTLKDNFTILSFLIAFTVLFGKANDPVDELVTREY